MGGHDPLLLAYVVGPPADHARVHGAPVREIVWKEHLVAGDLHQHERLVLIEAGGGHRRRLQVALAQLPARALDEIGDALLRLDPLVDVLVAREHDADAVPHEQRLEQHAQLDVRAVATAVGVERMVEVGDLPRLRRVSQRLVGPGELFRVHQVVSRTKKRTFCRANV